MSAEQGSYETADESLVEQLATTALTLRQQMIKRQRKIAVMAAKSIDLRAKKAARDQPTVSIRQARQLVRLADQRRSHGLPPRIRSDALFTSASGKPDDSAGYFVELDARAMPPDAPARLTVYRSTETGTEPLYDITVSQRGQPDVSVLEQGRQLGEDELYAPLGFLQAAAAQYAR